MTRRSKAGSVPTDAETTPPLSARERELLEQLRGYELRGERISVKEFARRAGYADKAGIQRFRILRAALHAYAERTGARAGQTVQPMSEQVDLQRQIAVRDEEIARLTAANAELPTLREQLGAAEEARKAVEQDADRLRAMVSALVAFMGARSVVRAREIESELRAAASLLVPDLEETLRVFAPRDSERQTASEEAGPSDVPVPLALVPDDLQRINGKKTTVRRKNSKASQTKADA
jgi:hypothetical protein